MVSRLPTIWAWAAVVIPTLVGLALVAAPRDVLPAAAAVEDLGRVVGLRNVALSAMTLLALYLRTNRGLAFMLGARSAQEAADLTANLIAGEVAGALVPLVLGAISAAAAVAFWRRGEPTA
jgi:hypothetical protein